jgi:sensor domain CHASE-containing protein
MKVKILLALVIITAAALCGTCYKDWRHHNAEVTQRQQTVQQVNKLLDKEQKVNAQMVTEYNSLWDQCEKGVANYSLLTPVEKTKATMPNCGVQFVQ